MAGRSKREALSQTGAQAGGQKAIDGHRIDGDAERHLQQTEMKKNGAKGKLVGKKMRCKGAKSLNPKLRQRGFSD